MKERSTIQGLLSGEINRETDPNGWDDDAYLFSKSRAWANDRQWMLEQLTKVHYSVDRRLAMAMFAGGKTSSLEAYTAIASTSPYREDVSGILAEFRAWLEETVPLSESQATALNEQAIVVEVYAPEEWRALLENDSYSKDRRRSLAVYGAVPEFMGLRRALNKR